MKEVKISSFLGIPVVFLWSFSFFFFGGGGDFFLFVRTFSFFIFVILAFLYPCPCILLSVIFVLFPYRFPVSLYCPTYNDFISNQLLSGIFTFRHSYFCSLSVPFPPMCLSSPSSPHTSHLFGRRESDLVAINLNLLPHYCLSTILSRGCFHSLLGQTLKVCN
jgi:hypothetical protein